MKLDIGCARARIDFPGNTVFEDIAKLKVPLATYTASNRTGGKVGHPRVGGEHSNCKQLICREFTACKRATEQYTRFGDAI